MKTLVAKQILGNERKWFIVDAAWKNLGRLATSIARKISGRDQVDYTPHLDNGANVIIINADKITVTGTKEATKMYRTHSQYMGGLKETPFDKMKVKKPTHMLRHAIEGMLPKNRLTKNMAMRLKLVVGTAHDFEAQKPETIVL